MEKRFKDQLNLRFDAVADVGYATVTNAEMMRWWDRKRVTASIWQDLNDRWEERLFTDDDGDPVPLKIGKGDGFYVLAWGEDWLVPVSDWAEK